MFQYNYYNYKSKTLKYYCRYETLPTIVSPPCRAINLTVKALELNLDDIPLYFTNEPANKSYTRVSFRTKVVLLLPTLYDVKSIVVILQVNFEQIAPILELDDQNVWGR